MATGNCCVEIAIPWWLQAPKQKDWWRIDLEGHLEPLPQSGPQSELGCCVLSTRCHSEEGGKVSKDEVLFESFSNLMTGCAGCAGYAKLLQNPLLLFSKGGCLLPVRFKLKVTTETHACI